MKSNFTPKNLTYMKRFLQISGMTLLIMLFTDLRNNVNAQPAGDVSYQTFYDELSPYGRWVDYPEYGYVWCPDEGADFRPYNTNGHWVWSDDYEWMWVSDYSWGWAPFHYGRWFYDDMYGWMWMPGYEWSPAWVAWRSGSDYYGWAPLRPGIDISFGFSINSYAPPVNYWCFAPCRYITSPRIYDYCEGYNRNVTIINNTTIINNYHYSHNVFATGPRRVDAERFTNQRIASVRVRDLSRPGRTDFRNNEVSVYRPSIQRESNRTFAPRRADQYRGNNNIPARNDNRPDRRNFFNDRTERNNNNAIENRNNDRRNIFNNDRINRDNNQRQVERGNENNNIDLRNQRNNNEIQRRDINTDNNTRERGIRDVYPQDNRRGIDRPVDRNRFERQDQPIRNNDNFNRREARPENNNRGFSNNAPVREERRDVFNNRNNNQQQQRQSFPETRRQEQPRQFQQQQQPRQFQQAQPRQFQQQQPRQFQQPQRDNNNNNNRGGFNRARRS